MILNNPHQTNPISLSQGQQDQLAKSVLLQINEDEIVFPDNQHKKVILDQECYQETTLQTIKLPLVEPTQPVDKILLKFITHQIYNNMKNYDQIMTLCSIEKDNLNRAMQLCLENSARLPQTIIIGENNRYLENIYDWVTLRTHRPENLPELPEITLFTTELMNEATQEAFEERGIGSYACFPVIMLPKPELTGCYRKYDGKISLCLFNIESYVEMIVTP